MSYKLVNGSLSFSTHEIKRIKQLGANVVTYGRIPKNSEKETLIISPHISDIREVSSKEFQNRILPTSRVYFEEWVKEHNQGIAMRPYFVADLEQFSFSEKAGNYFWHDVDPCLISCHNPQEVMARFDEMNSFIY